MRGWSGRDGAEREVEARKGREDETTWGRQGGGEMKVKAEMGWQRRSSRHVK